MKLSKKRNGQKTKKWGQINKILNFNYNIFSYKIK
jgi:hypothetical protein